MKSTTPRDIFSSVREEKPMTSGFQNQNPLQNHSFPKSEPKAQHGQKPDEACLKVKEKRTFEPKPGH
jgi:hypothetical protein